MKTLFLAEVVVRKTYYLHDDTVEHTVTRIVEAESEDEACKKIEKHYDDKTDEYSVYYRVSIEDISELIR
jgi:hypothetical protein